MTVCEVCAAPTRAVDLDGRERLDVCTACAHALRREPRSAARSHAAGGDTARDAFRTSTTYRRIRRAVRGLDVRTVYEVGYGSGALLRHFVDDGARVAGCDPGMLEVDVDDVVRREGSLTDLPLRHHDSPVADLVVAVHVVEHLPTAIPSLRDLASLVRPGGGVVIVTPTADCWGARHFWSDWWMLEDPTHERFYSPTSLETALHAAGARRVRVSRPVLDSLGCDGASWARRRSYGGAALDSASGRAASAAGIIPTLAARTVIPSTRPVLDAVARMP